MALKEGMIYQHPKPDRGWEIILTKAPGVGGGNLPLTCCRGTSMVKKS